MIIRPAEPADIPAILEMIQELADYEKEPDAVKNTPEMLNQTLFGENPKAFAEIIEDEVAVGIAIWFLNYSTWTGKHGLYLEDLYVKPEVRGKGYGKQMLIHLANKAVNNGWSRFEWSVLDWNKPAIDFYLAQGAKMMDEWTVCRVDGEALHALASQG
jgi:GNAT superfamily N-acetyltransferase